MDETGVRRIDTSKINWNEWFLYDETSPTCLRWKVNVYTTKGVITPFGRIGYVAGKKNGERSTVLLKGRRYKVPRVIWEMLVGRLDEYDVIDHRDGNPLNNKLSNLRAVPQPLNPRNAGMRSDNSSGVTGVSRVNNGAGAEYWTARWCDAQRKIKCKHFSIVKYGDSEAFELACDYRVKMIAELNEAGAGYTKEHGVRKSTPCA